MKKSVLIRSLPSEYQSTIFALKAAGLSKITFDDMVQRLKETEVGLKGQDELSQDENLERAHQKGLLGPEWKADEPTAAAVDGVD
ncbi:hypothetical protein M433DRAFT_10142 [Acidomyces richmondensis BFW]|nr:hypothetical protein M433DRAFT_10142 [Acidomyces richmondensis BFW]